MILMITVLCIILLGLLEIFLAGRRSKWPGLFLPVLALALLIPTMVSMASAYFPIPIMNYSYGDETLDDVKVYFGVVYDKEGDIAAFSDLKVKSRETEEVSWMPMEFDEKGKLVGGTEVMQYREAVQRLAEDVPEVKGKKSSSPNQMGWQYVKHNNNGYRDAALVMLLSFLSVISFFCIYAAMRKRVGKKERMEYEEKLRLLNDL